jgi:starch-binding outer membrane protein, SusD/RagB family
MKTANRNIIIVCLGVMMLMACKKDFLEKNPRTDLIIPNTTQALWALLDNDGIMNRTPTLGELSADNYYLTFSYWQILPQNHERYSYIWAADIYDGQQNVDDWSRAYTQVLHANTVLEGLKLVPATTSIVEKKEIRGAALFFRANAYYNLAQLFAKQYDSTTANSDMGLPIRTDPDINVHVPRHSVKQTYDSILTYLDSAENLVMPTITYNNKNRVSKPAVLALKARVFLSMRAYAKAGEFADLALQLHDSLINYNDLDPFALIPFTNRNKETIFHSRFTDQTQTMAAFIYPEVIIDSTLLSMYDADDLRHSIYYTNFISGNYNLKGNYSATISPFSGLATDELYLIRAEANAILGNVPAAIADLNKLLSNRYKNNTFVPLNPATPAEALQLIRDERRKELAFRGIRWTDLRRFNKEGANIKLERVLNGNTYTLLPNSPLYVLPIPPEVLNLGRIPDNQRQ